MPVTTVEVGNEAPREIPENATITVPRPDYEVREEIARVVREADDLVEDLALAVVVRTRMAEDNGERVPLAQFIRQEGFDPADFDL